MTMLEFGWLNVDCNDDEIRIHLIITNHDLHICMLHEHSPDRSIVLAIGDTAHFYPLRAQHAVSQHLLASSCPRPLSSSSLLVYRVL